jgi:ankyrin repeat protein
MAPQYTILRFPSHGVSPEAKNYEGSTAAFTAAAGGSIPVLELLASAGADLGAVNSYGDSPLEAATENHHDAAVSFLKSKGAVQVKGTPEQRDAASHAIVRRDIERMQHLH